jgi:stage III sporulation protein AH
MNNKRQTIWLVSMLSLMVILSAYYLFTEDVSPAQNASDNTEQTGVLDPTSSPEKKPDGMQVTEINPITDLGTDGVSDAAGTNDTAKDEGKIDQTASMSPEEEGKIDQTASMSPQDEAVIKELGNSKGRQLLDNLQRVRKENVSREQERLSGIFSAAKSTPDEAKNAAEELTRLEEMDERITSLEEKLLEDFDNAVVSEEKSNFKVIVLSDKLEKKQAVGILDLALKELNVTPDRVTIEYVKTS